MTALLTFKDVEAALLRPLTDSEYEYIFPVLDRVSALLRQVRAVDERIAAWNTDPTDPRGYNPVAVAGMLAEVVKRVLVNPKGLWSRGGSVTGPYTEPTETYAANRGGAEAAISPGLRITSTDLEQLDRPSYTSASTIRTQPLHQPAEHLRP